MSKAPMTVGRDVERARIAWLLDRGTAGPRALLIEGAVGIGKTTLVTTAVAHAETDGWTVLRCSPGSNETGYAYAALADLIGSVELPSIPDVQRRALQAVSDRAAQPDPHLVAAATTSVLRALVARRPVLLVVDDVQWLDAATDAVLQFASRRLADAQLAVMVTRRTDRPGAPPWGLEFERLWLSGLSQDEVYELVLERLHSPLPRPALSRLHATCQGNPLMTLEMVTAHLRHGRPDDPWPVPASLVHLISPRSDKSDVLLAASAMASPTVEKLRAALGADVSAALEAAELASLLQVRGDKVEFTHPMVAAVIYSEAPVPWRRAIHRRLAAVEADVESQARHLALGSIGTDETVARLLENAADHARRRRALTDAAELLRPAKSRTPSHAVDAAGRRVVLLGQALLESGDVTAARELLDEEIPQLAAGPVRARALLVRGTIAWYQQNGVQAAKLLESALDDAKADRKLTGQLHSRLSVFSDNDCAEAYRHASLAVAALSDEPDLLADAMINLCHTGTQLGLPPPPEFPVARSDSTIPGTWYLATDSTVDRARAGFTAILARGDVSTEADVLARLGEVELVAGNLLAARRHADAAMTAARQIGQQFCDPARRLRAYVDAHAGHLDEARQVATDGADRAEASGDLATAVAYLSVLTFIAASEADPTAVVGYTERTRRHLATMGIKEPIGRADPAAERICALAELGHVETAAAELAEFDQRYEQFPRPWMRPALVRARATLAAAHGDISDAISIASPLSEWSRFDQARVLLLRGRLLRRARRPGAATAALFSAKETLSALGYPAWTALAHDELTRAGRRRGATPNLTLTERKVAELVAHGMTTKKAAAALFMSPRTVEAHIASAYRKLGIRSRAELGRLMT